MRRIMNTLKKPPTLEVITLLDFRVNLRIFSGEKFCCRKNFSAQQLSRICFTCGIIIGFIYTAWSTAPTTLQKVFHIGEILCPTKNRLFQSDRLYRAVAWYNS